MSVTEENVAKILEAIPMEKVTNKLRMLVDPIIKDALLFTRLFGDMG